MQYWKCTISLNDEETKQLIELKKIYFLDVDFFKF